MSLGAPAQIVVGALGAFELEAGYYLYVGGALNGLAGRLRRHLRTDDKQLYWHIDYLRAQTELVEIWWTVAAERLECDWAAAVRGLSGASEPVPRFGASDCRCSSHLFYLPDEPSFNEFTAHWPSRDIHRLNPKQEVR
jgi:Uri superfamily endonuclease